MVPTGCTTMRSPSSRRSKNRVHKLRIVPLDPGFYSRVICYADAWDCLQHETRPAGQEADMSANAVLVSDKSVMKSLILSERQSRRAVEPQAISIIWCLFSSIRGPKFMDSFIYHSVDTRHHVAYMRAVCQHWLTKIFASNSDNMLTVYIFLGGLIKTIAILETVMRILNLSALVFSKLFCGETCCSTPCTTGI